MKLLDSYKGLAAVSLNNGSSCKLWDDLWAGRVPKLAFPELYSFAHHTSISVQKAKTIGDFGHLFHLHVSGQAFQQLQTLLDALEFNANSDEQDIWTYIWGSHAFSSAKAYRHLMGTAIVHPCYSWLWKSLVQHKHKTFFWLLLKDRLSTRGLLRRKNMELPIYDCVLCMTASEESLEHLFLQCHLAQQCWNLLNIYVSDHHDPLASLESFKVQLNVPFFMDIIIIMCWSIWMAHDDLIFRGL